MQSRKTVFIPLFSLGDRNARHILEIIVEPGPLGTREPDFTQLTAHGLDMAITDAKAALAGFQLPPTARRPVLFPVRPAPGLSNAAGAALGVALGLLMYYGLCRGERLLATGGLRSTPTGIEVLETKLAAALALPLQPRPLPFVFPARHENEPVMKTLQRDLHDLNIRPAPVAFLDEAIAACAALAEEEGNV
ncbi:MAG: hypothetical protein GY862_19830 [Gammaproteobacteria bacterium]|nr:hypothetical protein [Gammaproteobacteria bacterium]